MSKRLQIAIGLLAFWALTFVVALATKRPAFEILVPFAILPLIVWLVFWTACVLYGENDARKETGPVGGSGDSGASAAGVQPGVDPHQDGQGQ